LAKLAGSIHNIVAMTFRSTSTSSCFQWRRPSFKIPLPHL